MPERVLLLIPTTSYRTDDFMEAAGRLGVEVVVGTDRRQALESVLPGHTVALDLVDPERRLAAIVELAEAAPFRAVIGVDDETVLAAALAAERLGLAHNPVAAVAATRDKHTMRRRLADAGLRSPRFRRIPLDADLGRLAREVSYPCVVKPLALSASRGVLRANDPVELSAAFRRVAAILASPDARRRSGDHEHLLVEDYLPGSEVALEGLLVEGALRVLALFDKPDSPEGPTFEETMFVTPSRHGPAVRRAVAGETEAACRALGLVDGPVHAELRVDRGVPWMLEVAARTIGGLCARSLRFGTGVSLEEIVLRHALGRDVAGLRRERAASGVLMLPIPRAGKLLGVSGLDEARAVDGVREVSITMHEGADVTPLPEGHRYLGFVFATAPSPAEVEAALRRAQGRLRIRIA
jgi:biotin carboxylase